MIGEIILAIVVVWTVIYLAGQHRLARLDVILKVVIRETGYIIPPYTIRENTQSTGSYTTFTTIPSVVVCTRRPNGSNYDDQTVLYVTLHEIAHILTPGHAHDQQFQTVEHQLLATARRLQFLTANDIDRDYPCHTD